MNYERSGRGGLTALPFSVEGEKSRWVKDGRRCKTAYQSAAWMSGRRRFVDTFLLFTSRQHYVFLTSSFTPFHRAILGTSFLTCELRTVCHCAGPFSLLFCNYADFSLEKSQSPDARAISCLRAASITDGGSVGCIFESHPSIFFNEMSPPRRSGKRKIHNISCH